MSRRMSSPLRRLTRSPPALQSRPTTAIRAHPARGFGADCSGQFHGPGTSITQPSNATSAAAIAAGSSSSPHWQACAGRASTRISRLAASQSRAIASLYGENETNCHATRSRECGRDLGMLGSTRWILLVLLTPSIASAEGEYGPMFGGSLVASHETDATELGGAGLELGVWRGRLGVALE